MYLGDSTCCSICSFTFGEGKLRKELHCLLQSGEGYKKITDKHEQTNAAWMTDAQCGFVLLTLFFLGVVVLFVDVCSLVYGVGEQLEGVHHLYVSTFLFANQGSNHCNKHRQLG